MFSSLQFDESRPFLAWQLIVDWAQQHYRCRTFERDERIPTRPQLLYLVHKGAVRLVVNYQAQVAQNNESQSVPVESIPEEEGFLGFVGAGQPFELVAHAPFLLQAYAHINDTSIVWLYWHDLDNWPHFRREILDAFRYQHQRKLLWMTILGQRKSIDRLLGFLTLLVQEYGKPCDYVDQGRVERGYYLPWSITQTQMANAIGVTRVTVTRLMAELRSLGLVRISEDNLIYMPTLGQIGKTID